MSRINIFFKISLLILLVWGAQILFLNQAANFGMNGSDDWGWLFHYDNRRPVENLFFINTDVGNPYDIQQAYSIGVLKTIFGLDVKAFKLVHLFFKALAALSAAYLVFKLTKDKLFAVLVIIFFITFPSTAGILSHIVLGFNYSQYSP